MSIEKATLRKQLRASGQTLAIEKKISWSFAIQEQLVRLIIDRGARRVSLYQSMAHEPLLASLVAREELKDRTFYLPQIKGRDLIWILTKLADSENTNVHPELIQGKETTKSEAMDLFIVPGIAFDMQGFRLGYGGGYFDRLQKNSSAKVVGVTYHYFLLDSLPKDHWDRPMDIIVTEKATIELAN